MSGLTLESVERVVEAFAQAAEEMLPGITERALGILEVKASRAEVVRLRAPRLPGEATPEAYLRALSWVAALPTVRPERVKSKRK